MLSRLNIDAREIVDLEKTFRQAGPKARPAIRAAVNRTGDMAGTQVVRTLTAQTGLKRKVIFRAVKRRRAGFGELTYVLASRGGNISLKHFSAKETRAGVTAAPWGERRLYPRTFIKGGLFPRRKGLPFGGQVFARAGGAKRLPISPVKSGLFIPEEMVKGATAEAFMLTVRTILPRRLQHELARILG